jgi:RNA polymerase sigma-70 factor (ECF subfamily)
MGEGVGDRSHLAWDGQATDAALVQATRAGDLRAWEHLVRRHQEVVFRSAYLATRQAVIAEDVARAAFVRAHHSLGSLKEGIAVRPWLVGITATVARSHLRELAQRRDAKLPIRESTPRLPASPHRFEPGVPVPTPVEQEILQGAIDGMRDEDRLILAARYSFGFPSADAAALLGIEPAHVDERLRTSVQRLRARMAQPPGAPGSRMADVSTTAGGARRSDRLVVLSDDQIGSMTMLVAFQGLAWSPDVAPAISARLARQAAAYPEQPLSHAVESGVPSGDASPAPQARPSRPEGRTSLAGVSASPRRRGRGQAVLRAAVLVTGFAVLGFALAAAAQGWELPDDMRGQVDALLGQPSDRSGETEGAEGAGMAVPVTRDPELTVPLGQPAIVPLGEGVPALGPESGPDEVPHFSIVGSRTLRNGDVAAQVRIDWRPGGDVGPVVSSRLERSLAGGSWTEVAAADAGATLVTMLGPDRRHSFRVMAVDDTGTETVSPPIGVQLRVRDPRSKRLARESGEWITRRGNIIKLRLIATAPDSSLNTEFSGSSVARRAGRPGSRRHRRARR